MKIQNVLVAIPADEAHRAKLEAAAPGASFQYIPAKEVTKEDAQKAEVVIGQCRPRPADRFPQSKMGPAQQRWHRRIHHRRPAGGHHPDQCHRGLRPDHLGAHAGLDPELDEASAHLPGPPSREAVERCRPGEIGVRLHRADPRSGGHRGGVCPQGKGPGCLHHWGAPHQGPEAGLPG